MKNICLFTASIPHHCDHPIPQHDNALARLTLSVLTHFMFQ